MKKCGKIFGWIMICQLAGIIGAGLTVSSVQTWYVNLNKPWFTPPNWLFGPMWLTLYTLMGVATYLVAEKKTHQAKQAVKLFLIHLVINALWSPVFFGLRQIFLGLIVILTIWVLIIVLFFRYKKIDIRAGLMLVPYFLWVSLASMLNLAIWKLN